ncbi:hypothetical protein EMIT074MI3_20267 [Bacillus licheniformis]
MKISPNTTVTQYIVFLTGKDNLYNSRNTRAGDDHDSIGIQGTHP